MSKAMAADHSTGQPDVFPKNRFSLELVDPLLDGPCVFPLTKPIVTVGLSGTGNSWNLPLERMGLDATTLMGNAEWVARPLLALEFCSEAGTWKVELTYRPSVNQCGEMKRVWDESFSKLEPGSTRLELWLPYCWKCPIHCACCGDLGGFTLILHDSAKPHSTFTQKLASLPDNILGMIGSELHPDNCLRHLCAFSQSIATKLCTSVQWPGLRFLDIKGSGEEINCPYTITNFLDCLRVAKLLRNSDCLESLFLGRGACYERRMFTDNRLFDMVKRFIYAPKLQHLGLASCWLSVLDVTVHLPKSLRTIYVEFDGGTFHDDCNGLWLKISALKCPPSTEVSVKFTEPRSMSKESDDVSMKIHADVPNVTKVDFVYWKRYFLPRTGLTNLRMLELSMCEWNRICTDEGNMRNGVQHLSEDLAASSFPSLKEVSILEIRVDCLELLLDGLAAAAPNLKVLMLHVLAMSDDHLSVTPTGPTMTHFRSSLDSVRRFEMLRHFKFLCADRGWLVGLETVLNFCLGMRSTVSLIEFDEVSCDDLRSGYAAILDRCVSLKERGKTVELVERYLEAKNPLRLPEDCSISCCSFSPAYRAVLCKLTVRDE